MAGIVLTNTGLDVFLDGTPSLRDGASARAADAVLSLLALCGADRRSGLPEPSVALVRHVLVEEVPSFVYATPEELAAYPAVLLALTERVREAGRLNGKRQARIVAAVEDAVPDFERAMTDPGNLTWHRWYASLLRADGVDPDDPKAVRVWLAAHQDVRPPDGLYRADLMNRSVMADSALAESLMRAYLREAEAPSPAGPLLSDADVSHGVSRVTAALADRWTAAGLAEALAGPYAHLAPGPESFPHLVLADTLLDEHLNYYGDSWIPLPPPPVHAADPGDSLEDGANLLAAAVDEMKGETGGLYDGEAAHLLYALYQRGSCAESVARRAAEFEDWPVDPRLEDAPVRVPAEAPETYEVPPAEELARLCGTRATVTEADRERLVAPASAMAGTVDRLAETGMVFRTGDAFGLTPRGVTVVRYLLRVGHVTAPDAAQAADWDATTVVAAAEGWSASAAARVLADWLHAHGDTAEAWSQLLSAIATVNAGTHDAADTRALFRALDAASAPTEALRGALGDPVVGAYAWVALRARGEAGDEDRVPRSAHALLILDRLTRAHDRAAFDSAAASWPGGAEALVKEMAAADPHQAERTFGRLGIVVPGPPPVQRARRRDRGRRRAR